MKRVVLVGIIALASNCGGGATCTNMVVCDSGSYSACSDGARCWLVASDGSRFDCSSCGDCAVATTKAASWCGAPAVGGNGSGNVDGGVIVSGCVTQTVCANSLKDCAAGQRCNTALNPPVCQALYCGGTGTSCGGDSLNDLCASRMCVGGVCSAPPDMAGASGSCCQPGHAGNELGVGKYCMTQNDCAGQSMVCTTLLGNGRTMGFCTMPCMIGNSCGSNAICMGGADAGTNGACVPTNCTTNGCW